MLNIIETLKVSKTAIDVRSGDGVFIPAQDGEIEICGECTFLLSYVKLQGVS